MSLHMLMAVAAALNLWFLLVKFKRDSKNYHKEKPWVACASDAVVSTFIVVSPFL